MQLFFDTLDAHLKLNEEELAFLKANVRTLQIPKKEALLKKGHISTSFYFVLQGCVCMFYHLSDSKKAAFFYTEGRFVSAYESYTKQLPTKYSFEAVEDCILIEISAVAAEKLLAFSAAFSLLAQKVMEEELIVYQEIISTFVTMSAEQRYDFLCTQRAELIQRVPQYLIASYLGVTPETLTRIRNRRLRS